MSEYHDQSKCNLRRAELRAERTLEAMKHLSSELQLGEERAGLCEKHYVVAEARGPEFRGVDVILVADNVVPTASVAVPAAPASSLAPAATLAPSRATFALQMPSDFHLHVHFPDGVPGGVVPPAPASAPAPALASAPVDADEVSTGSVPVDALSVTMDASMVALDLAVQADTKADLALGVLPEDEFNLGFNTQLIRPDEMPQGNLTDSVLGLLQVRYAHHSGFVLGGEVGGMSERPVVGARLGWRWALSRSSRHEYRLWLGVVPGYRYVGADNLQAEALLGLEAQLDIGLWSIGLAVEPKLLGQPSKYANLPPVDWWPYDRAEFPWVPGFSAGIIFARVIK